MVVYLVKNSPEIYSAFLYPQNAYTGPLRIQNRPVSSLPFHSSKTHSLALIYSFHKSKSKLMVSLCCLFLSAPPYQVCNA
jgi:hypothetical protein